MALNEQTLRLKGTITGAVGKIKSLFVRKSEVSDKTEVNGKSIKLMLGGFIFLFVVVTILLPNKVPVQFSVKIDHSSDQGQSAAANSKTSDASASATALWSAPRMNLPTGQGSQINYNTPMVLNESRNANTQVPAGVRLHLKLLDSFTVDNNSVPVLAQLIFDATTDSGLTLPAGTEFYGSASYQKGSGRATVQFNQISLPSGEMKQISGIAVGSDGEPGISGDVHSDAVKNTAGEMLTTFVGGLAAGSMQTDILGHSAGGIQNGLLQAASTTAKNMAQNYGQRLQTEREWIVVPQGTEFDAILSNSLNLQKGGE